MIPKLKKIAKEGLAQNDSEFFRITESLCYEFSGFLDLSFDTFNDELFANIDKFKAEIVENIRTKNQTDRNFYLNSILKRLNKSIGITILKNKKTGREYPYLQSTFEGIKNVDTTKVNDLEVYYRMSNDYKKQMVNFISQQIETSKTKQTEINPNLKLSDVLLKGIQADEVKKLYKDKLHTYEYLGMFLRYLNQLGYFCPPLKGKQIQTIGRNDFKALFKDRNSYNTRNLNTDDSRFKHIPTDPRSLIK